MAAWANRHHGSHIISASRGVAMNVKITHDIAVHVKNHGLRAIRHRKVLLGDAGISMGWGFGIIRT